MIGFRYGQVLRTSRGAALEYTLDVIPAVVVSRPDLASSTGLKRVYGAGILPVGFKGIFRRQSRVQPFGDMDSGPVYFTSQVPRPDAARLNFLSKIGAGVQILSSRRRALILEYAFGHLSNAGISRVNPGINMNVSSVGVSVFK